MNSKFESDFGVHSIDHFAIEMPDLEKATHFLTNFGMKVESMTDHLLVRSSKGEHIWAVVLKGKRKKLVYVSMGCYGGELEAIRLQVESAGGEFFGKNEGKQDQDFWFRDPDGILFQVKVAEKTQPDSKEPMPDLSVPSNVRGAPARSKADFINPTRLSHLALFSSNISRSIDFHMQALGVRLADRSGEIIGFTYGRHGSDHHLLAFISGGGPGLHHSSWDVPSVEQCGLINSQLRRAGYKTHWGPGRHVLGSNYFNYAKDSAGGWWEASAHIDYIDKDASWSTANYSDEDALYLWGPDMPRDFPNNPEL